MAIKQIWVLSFLDSMGTVYKTVEHGSEPTLQTLETIFNTTLPKPYSIRVQPYFRHRHTDSGEAPFKKIEFATKPVKEQVTMTEKELDSVIHIIRRAIDTVYCKSMKPKAIFVSEHVYRYIAHTHARSYDAACAALGADLKNLVTLTIDGYSLYSSPQLKGTEVHVSI